MGRIGVLISGGGTNLQALMDGCEQGIIKGEVSCVISSHPNAYGLTRAKNSGIDHYYLTNSSEIIRCLTEHGVDLVVLAGYLKQLPRDVIQAFPDRILNVHPSLIPSFSGKGFYGLRVHQAALNRGVKVSGATVHIVNEALDEGPILKQAACEVYENDTALDLQERVLDIEHRLLVEAVMEMIEQ